ncbi:MAG: outer membrane protein assembly factor BamD [Planctomycetota bacterium]|jgi:outer membrane protein assembly factor BamD (BamD/ComL family)
MARIKIVKRTNLLLLSLLTLVSSLGAETWHLEKGNDWKQVQPDTQDNFLMAVTGIKDLINNGKTRQVRRAYENLKQEFPQIQGPDVDAFIKAELLYAKRKFNKSVREYDNFMDNYPESELYQVALDRQFSIAQAYLAGQKRTVLKIFRIRGYSEGEKIMDKISDRAGIAPLAERANIAVAQSNESRGKYEDAYQRWSQILSKWPTGQTGKNALLAMARCKYLAYNGPKYDVSDLVSARTYYQNFKSRYPDDAKELDIDSRIQNIDELLAEKQFKIAQFYQKTANVDSAGIYYKVIAEQWPNTSAAKISGKVLHETNQQGEKVKNE